MRTISFRRNPDVIAAEAAGETVLLNVTSWVYLSFNGTGAWIWGYLEQPRTPDDLCAAAEEEFDAAPAEIRRDIEEFLSDVVSKGFVLRNDAS